MTMPAKYQRDSTNAAASFQNCCKSLEDVEMATVRGFGLERHRAPSIVGNSPFSSEGA